MWFILALLCFALAFVFHAFGFAHNPLDWEGMVALGMVFSAFGWLWPFTPWHRP